MTLVARVRTNADQLVHEAATAVEQARLHHYTVLGPDLTRDRIGRLLEATIESLAHASPIRIVQHAEQVAVERFHAGFGIDEIQVAFNTLEGALWRFLVRESPTDQLADDLGQVGAVLGAGKDHLARTYVRLASREHHPCVDVDALFQAV